MQGEIFVDVLTQAFNRRYLYDYLPPLLKRAEKERLSIGILMIDMDNFKRVNDDFGHLVGDKVLKELVKILKKNLREQDKVIRYAGDEFIIVVENGEISYLKKIATRIKEEVEKAVFENNIKCTISIGIARYPQDAKCLEELIELADQALYFSKRRGKNKLYLISEVKKEEIALKLAKTLFPCKKFIGREKEILEAKRFFDKALNEYRPFCFFVKGDQGIGKTRFLNQINNYFKNKCFYFSSVGDKEKIKIPYYLITEAIENFIKQQKKEFIKEIATTLSPQTISQLSPFFPQLKEILEITSSQEKINLDQRFFLFKAFRDLILAFLRKKAVLISFDNLHYADIATLELIYYFLKSPHQLPLLINGAYISQELKDAQIPLLEILNNFRKEERFKEIILEGFNQEEIKEMIEAIFPGLVLPEVFIEKIERITSGNPFFVEEVLKLLIEENIIVYQENEWQIKEKAEKLDFSFSIEEIMRRKLSTLDPEVKEVLFEAALIGQRFDAKTLSKVHNRDEGYILDVLEKAKSMHLIKEDISGNNFYFNFVTPLIKETISTEAEKSSDIKEKINRQEFTVSLSKYQKLLQEFSESISSQDIEKYLEELALEEPLVEEIYLDFQTTQDIYELIRLMVTSIKNIRLFPPTNSVRVNLLKNSYQLLKKILDKIERINFEVVEEKLFVNGKVFSKKEGGYLYIDYFLSLLKEFNISSIGIYKDVQEQEFNLFLEGLSFPPQEIVSQGGWGKFLKDMVVTHIKIRESYKEKVKKERIKDVMLLDYLVGKGLNKDHFLEILKESPEEIAYLLKMLSSQEVSEEKFKIIKENIKQIVEEIKEISASEEYLGKLKELASLLDSPVREKVFSEEVKKEILPSAEEAESVNVVDLVEKEFIESKGSILSLRNVIKNNLKSMTREEIYQVSQKLKELGIDGELSSFIVGDISFKEVKIDKKIKIVEDISSYDESLLDEEILRDIFTELLNLKKEKELIHLLRTIFFKIEEGVIEKTRFLNFLINFTNSAFFGEREEMSFFISVLLKAILIEEEIVLRNIFYLLGYIVKEISYRLNQNLDEENLKYYAFMAELLEVIKKRKEREKDEVLSKEIEGWLSEFYSKKFIENTLLLFEKFIDSEKTEDLKRMIINLKDTLSFPYLIELVFQEKEEKDFESFIKKRKLFIVLEKIKDSLVKEIFNLIKKNEIVITKELIQFLIYAKEIESLEKIYFSTSVTPQLKEEIVRGLKKIASFKAEEILKRIYKEEKEKKLKALIERVLKR